MHGYGSPYKYSANPYWTPGVKFLIITNVVVFGIQILCLFVQSTWHWGLARLLSKYFALNPKNVIEDFYLWQLITNVFLHDEGNIFHLLFNLLALYFMGHLPERHYGTRKFLIFYFCCAVFASLSYTVVNFAPQTRTIPALGASGAIMGVLTLAACLYPNQIIYLQFLFPVRLKTVVWILIGFNIYLALPFQNAGTGIAVSCHLGGILFGYLYYRYSPRIERFFAKLEYKVQEEYQKEQCKKEKNVRQEVDQLLDKIHEQGIGSLSDREKEFLQRASKEYQKDINS